LYCGTVLRHPAQAAKGWSVPAFGSTTGRAFIWIALIFAGVLYPSGELDERGTQLFDRIEGGFTHEGGRQRPIYRAGTRRRRETNRRTISGKHPDAIGRHSVIFLLRLFTAALAIGFVTDDVAHARPERHLNEGVIRGVIRKYECVDNCYLTIVDSSKREITGLCVARECKDWNKASEMPASYLGKKNYS
jgi:hypothetical protein